MTGLTISKEQLSEATARIKSLGLEDQVTLLFCDYRDCPGGEEEEGSWGCSHPNICFGYQVIVFSIGSPPHQALGLMTRW